MAIALGALYLRLGALNALATTPDPVIMAAGDIACDPTSVHFNGGAGTVSDCSEQATSDLLVAGHPDAVLTLGDTQYEDNQLWKYQQSYNPTWGREKSITHPAIGNHEYLTKDAAGYFDYFGGAAGTPSTSWYSYNLGSWHLISLNSNCERIGGCQVGSPEERWLRADLAAHPAECTLAYWHHPYFSSGQHGDEPFTRDLWIDLYKAGADIVLNGHDHDYERFAPQDYNGVANPKYGIREFVVGTGGKNHYRFINIQPNSEVRNADTFGVLKLTLHSSGYDWQFLPQAGHTFSDSGTGSCHGTPASIPTPAPTVTSVPVSTSTPTPTPTAIPTISASGYRKSWQPTLPIRAAFYYPWFPEAWTQHGIHPYSNYHPSRGWYSITPRTVRADISSMLYGHIQAGIASWWGPGTASNGRIPLLLRMAAHRHFRWALYYEAGPNGNPTVARIRSELEYIRTHFAGSPAYLRINGRFVVFVFETTPDGCDMAARWKAANTVGAYIVLKVFPGYRNCSAQPDSWHQYAPAVAETNQQGYSFSISPGYWKVGEAHLLPRSLPRWKREIRDMVASNDPWQLITTFNEWGEGTAIEGATAWRSRSGYGKYLDALHAIPTRSAGLDTLSAAPPDTTAVHVMAAGDIACDPSDPHFNGGLGTSNYCRMRDTAALIEHAHPDAVLALGDMQYENGQLAKYRLSYDKSWGQFKDITYPTPGGGHDQYGLGDYYRYWGTRAGPSARQTWYAVDIGTWRIISLNPNCAVVGGCLPGNPEYRWLQRELTTHRNLCTIAMWHYPRWSSGEYGDQAQTDAFVRLLYKYGVDLLLTGHDHDYERLAPLDPNGNVDAPHGIREFVVGTGGRNHFPINATRPHTVAENAETFGVLDLILKPTSYAWHFLPIPGETFSDSGTAMCH